jgi:hypothetical protein
MLGWGKISIWPHKKMGQKLMIALCNTHLLVNLQLIAKSWPHKKMGWDKK